MAVSKTSWGSEATYAQMIAPDGFGEKWVDVPMGHYILGKAGDWFIGNASNLPYSWIDLTHARNYYDSYEWNQNTVVIGNPRSFQKNGSSPNIVTTADFDQEIDKRKSDDTPGGCLPLCSDELQGWPEHVQVGVLDHSSLPSLCPLQASRRNRALRRVR